jgi:NitT/TauT family transport system substrate-binding protein
MKTKAVLGLCLALAAGFTLSGCPGKKGSDGGSDAGDKPVFTLAWSEYPSWSVFGVAHEKGLINGAKGELGPIEKKWGVDIVLKEAEYDPCITMYNTSACDAVCITNMDVLNPSLGRTSVAIMPTSTSVGADACIVTGIDVADKKKAVKELRKRKVYGLEKSVSEYVFVRNLELLGEKESDHHFTNKDPGAAAQAMQTGEYDAIMVWNPFVLQTLKNNKKAKVLFDSSTIPEEIIDMVVIGKDSLAKPGGKQFACAVIDTYYEMNRMLADEKKGDKTLVALGAKFSNLNLAEIKKAVQQTRFYKNPEEALKLFEGDHFKEKNRGVVAFCLKHKIIKQAPKLAYGSDDKGDYQLRFDPAFIKEVRDKK